MMIEIDRKCPTDQNVTTQSAGEVTLNLRKARFHRASGSRGPSRGSATPLTLPRGKAAASLPTASAT